MQTPFQFFRYTYTYVLITPEVFLITPEVFLITPKVILITPKVILVINVTCSRGDIEKKVE